MIELTMLKEKQFRRLAEALAKTVPARHNDQMTQTTELELPNSVRQNQMVLARLRTSISLR
jgi:hypothetical protein